MTDEDMKNIRKTAEKLNFNQVVDLVKPIPQYSKQGKEHAIRRRDGSEKPENIFRKKA